MRAQRTTAKKLTALAVLPFAGALSLSACAGDDATSANSDALNVNIEPVETTVEEPETTVQEPETTLNDTDEPTGEFSETAFTQNENGVEMTLTYIHQGDRVVKQTTRNVIDYEAAGFGDKEQAQQILDPMVAEADVVEGYEQSIEYGDTSAVEEVSIDYLVVDMRQLGGLPGFEGSENMEEALFVSLSESRKMLESQGFTEVE